MKSLSLLLLALALASCQTSGSRMVQLQQICADPSNRAAGSFYYQECQTLYPLKAKQRQREESLARGVGDE